MATLDERITALAQAVGADIKALQDARGGGPTLQGDTAPCVTETETYQITNYNSFSSYAVSASAGTASLSGDTIIFTAPASAGNVSLTLTVDGQPTVFTVTVIGLKAPDITVRYAVAGDWTITLQLAGGSAFAEVLRVYRSTEPLDLEALPEHVAELGADAEQWVDADVEYGQTYYYAVGAYVGGVVAMSAVVEREAVWTPAELTVPPQIWLDDSSEIVGTTTAAAWKNMGSVGGNFAQAGASSRPIVVTLGGRRALRFNGSKWLSLASAAAGGMLAGKTSASIFVVGKSLGAANRYQVLFYAPNLNPPGFQKLLYWWGSPNNTNRAIGFRLATEAYVASGYASGALEMNYADIDLLAKISEHFHDGHAGATATGTMWGDNFGGNTQANTLMIGANFWYTADNLNADIAAVFVFNRKLSAEERQRMEGWAAHRYGLTGNLPPDHPYKSVAP